MWAMAARPDSVAVRMVGAVLVVAGRTRSWWMEQLGCIEHSSHQPHVPTRYTLRGTPTVGTCGQAGNSDLSIRMLTRLSTCPHVGDGSQAGFCGGADGWGGIGCCGADT